VRDAGARFIFVGWGIEVTRVRYRLARRLRLLGADNRELRKIQEGKQRKGEDARANSGEHGNLAGESTSTRPRKLYFAGNAGKKWAALGIEGKA